MESVEVAASKVVPCLELAITRLEQLKQILISYGDRVIIFEYPPELPQLPNQPVPTFCGGPCHAAPLLLGDEPTSVVVERLAGLMYVIALVVENEPKGSS